MKKNLWILSFVFLLFMGCQEMNGFNNEGGAIIDVQSLKTEPETSSVQDAQNPSEEESEPESESDREPEITTEPDSKQELESNTPEDSDIVTIPETKKLTLLVYMAADNDLESYAIQNLKAMEHSGFSNMNVLVLLDRAEDYDATNGDWKDTRLFELAHDETEGSFIVSKRLSCPNLGLSDSFETELDMANPNILRNFISFAKSEYEAEKYALIIWGHGTGWRGESVEMENPAYRAVAIDDMSNSYMTVCDMGKSLKNLGLCVIGFDTCFGAVFENVYEIKKCADYTVASPGVSPSAGWKYEQLLEDISESDFTANVIAQKMAASSLVSSTVFTNSRLRNVMESFEDFSEALSQTIIDKESHDRVFEELSAFMNNRRAYFYSHGKSDVYLDMFSLAQQYCSNENTNLAEKAARLKTEINRSATTTNNENAMIGINYITRTENGILDTRHSTDYFKDYDNAMQCLFIKESQWWVPTRDGNSGSILDKLFYTVY